MNISLKIFISLLLFFSASIAVFAQTDTPKIKRIDNEINTTKSTNQLQAKSFKPASNQNIDLRIDKKLDIDVINKNLNTNKSNSNSTFLMETLPENNDIIGKKYWKGKDVTHKQLKSSVSMGTVYTEAKTVRVVCRDYSYVDGDIIKIYLNEKPLSNSISLKASSYMVYMKLDKGYNRIDFQAMNQGSSGPNTAELLLYDEHDNLIASKEWNLATGQTATIGVIQKD